MAKHAGGRPLKFKSPEEMWDKAQEYFVKQELDNKPILITGLAYHLETTRQTLCDYQEKDKFTDTIKRIKLRAEMYAENQLYEGKSAAGPIFALKNFDWSDKQETEVTGKDGGKIEYDVTVQGLSETSDFLKRVAAEASKRPLPKSK